MDKKSAFLKLKTSDSIKSTSNSTYNFNNINLRTVLGEDLFDRYKRFNIALKYVSSRADSNTESYITATPFNVQFNTNTPTVTNYTIPYLFKNGNYSFSASSERQNQAFARQMFDTNAAAWQSQAYNFNEQPDSHGYVYIQNAYNGINNDYVGGGTGFYWNTFIQGVGNAGGEWFQITYPYSFKLSDYTLKSTVIGRLCDKIYIVGSNDNGTTWYLVDDRHTLDLGSGILSISYTCSNPAYYTTYRCVVTSMNASNNLIITKWIMNGYITSSPNLKQCLIKLSGHNPVYTKDECILSVIEMPTNGFLNRSFINSAKLCFIPTENLNLTIDLYSMIEQSSILPLLNVDFVFGLEITGCDDFKIDNIMTQKLNI
jgi:hypothetical protein